MDKSWRNILIESREKNENFKTFTYICFLYFDAFFIKRSRYRSFKLGVRDLSVATNVENLFKGMNDIAGSVDGINYDNFKSYQNKLDKAFGLIQSKILELQDDIIKENKLNDIFIILNTNTIDRAKDFINKFQGDTTWLDDWKSRLAILLKELQKSADLQELVNKQEKVLIELEANFERAKKDFLDQGEQALGQYQEASLRLQSELNASRAQATKVEEESENLDQKTRVFVAWRINALKSKNEKIAEELELARKDLEIEKEERIKAEETVETLIVERKRLSGIEKRKRYQLRKIIREQEEKQLEINTKEQEIKRLNEAIEQAKEKDGKAVLQLTKEKDSLKSDLEKLKDKSLEDEKEKLRIQKQLEVMQNVSRELQTRLKDEKKKAQEEMSRREKAELLLGQVKQEMSDLNNELVDIKREQTDKLREINEKTEELKNKEVDIEKQKEKIEDLETNIKNQGQRGNVVSGLVQEKKELEKKLQQLQQSKFLDESKIQRQLNAMKKLNKTLHKDLQQKREMAEKQEIEAAENQQMVAELQVNLEKLEQKGLDVKTEKETLKLMQSKELEKLKKSEESATTELQEANEKLGKYEKDLKDMAERAKDLEGEKEYYENKVEIIFRARNDLQIVLESLKKMSNDRKTTKKDLAEALSKLVDPEL